MYNFKKTEREIEKFWKTVKSRKNKGKPYFLLDGPPYANFVPHVGHVRNTVYKDFYIRWAFMKGYNVLFQPGFDTHGLPIENAVEKKLKLKSKSDIERLGISKFVKLCKESATNNKDLWLDIYRRLGSHYASKTPYITYENNYLESAWWAFKQLWDKNLAYEGKRPVFWCPTCETALAGYEVTDSYKNVTDPSIYVKFKVKNKNEFLLVYTTTPWTLPSNVAIVVSSEADYVKVKTEKGVLIIAKNRLSLLKELKLKYELLKTFKGKKLKGLEYESILDIPLQKELAKNPNALKVYLSIPILKERVASKVAAKKNISSGDVFEEFVTVESGSGLVHTAPGHGKSDNEVGKVYKLPSPSPLDDSCKFTDDAGVFQGEFVKDADHAILDVLHKTDRLLNYDKIEHSYPLCWRCKAPLIFRMSNQWFLKVDPLKKKMLQSNERVDWQPDFAKDRFRNWVANAEDWNFSRQRYWGIPIPIWKCECGNIKVVGSVKDLEKNSKKLPKNFDLHTVSNIKLNCSCKKKMSRINDIFDVWFDSGCAPFAAFHYPFENKKLFESHFPVSRINEAQDQIRGWFYSLMFVGMGVFNKAPYKTVSMPGWVLDPNGDKMSKSLGNVVWAKDALKDYGSDAVRFYYFWDIDPVSTQKFNLAGNKLEVFKFFNILWNLHLLVLEENKLPQPKFSRVEDKWILSRTNTVLKNLYDSYDNFKLHSGTRDLYDFVVEDISRTYVQMTRERMADDKEPLAVLNHVLLRVVRALCSVSPFITEKIYQNLKKLNKLKDSVHNDSLPGLGDSNKKLEDEFSLASEIIASGLACRDRARVGVRWPLKELVIDSKPLKKLEPLIKQQLNIKNVVFKKPKFDIKTKPNFRSLGKSFGTETADVLELIKKREIKKFPLKLGKFKLGREHFIVEKISPDGFVVSEFKNGLVMLNLETNDELENEGFAREIVRRLQQLRKESDLKKSDLVNIYVFGADNLKKYLESYKKKIGAKKLEYKNIKGSVSFEVKNRTFRIGLKK